MMELYPDELGLKNILYFTLIGTGFCPKTPLNPEQARPPTEPA